MTDAVPVTVVIPTIGRAQLLEDCLSSLERCSPRAAEIVVVDQSGDDAVAEVVERFAGAGARRLFLAERNVAKARNLALREARHEVVVFTDDDCTVAESWVGTGLELIRADPDRIITGRVLPGGPDAPSVREDEQRHDHTGEVRGDALLTNNAVARRDDLLAFGAFDERFNFTAEDLDLGYRWLRAGRRLWYEPDIVVWHHAWRKGKDLSDLYSHYWREQGAVYGKHLRRGDPVILRFIARDVVYGLVWLAKSVVRRGESVRVPARRLRLLVAGLAKGLRYA